MDRKNGSDLMQLDNSCVNYCTYVCICQLEKDKIGKTGLRKYGCNSKGLRLMVSSL